MAESALERTLSRDRTIVVAALGMILLVSWIYILSGAGMNMSAFEMSSVDLALGQSDPAPTQMKDEMADMSGTMATMAMPAAWTMSYAALMFFMWWVMMIAMMVPSAAPMILLQARIARSAKSENPEPSLPWSTAFFAFGYLAAWAAFSVIALALQRLFESLGILSPMMLNSTNAIFAGSILLVAGVYQMTPLKQACLEHCRSPIGFLSQHWRDGLGGAFAMGLHHGLYCLGCCWGLMAILFFGGIMNLYWIIGLAVIVLLEKLLPIGPRVGQMIGAVLIVWGASFIYVALI